MSYIYRLPSRISGNVHVLYSKYSYHAILSPMERFNTTIPHNRTAYTEQKPSAPIQDYAIPLQNGKKTRTEGRRTSTYIPTRRSFTLRIT
ncbi:unnamed protein product [Periconia digitata]|uniref:Uncharacterized protein n=1 Tax=Periconia digitata TaxID=1303443 RepID=A0A9W4UME3_9PLEO|nr:unnamed protein product [Periconia digitata]